MTSPLSKHLERQIRGATRFFWHRLRWRLVEEHLPPSPDFTLLDVGAGAGVVGEFLADRHPSARYHFVEPLEAMRSHLSDRFGSSRDLLGQERYDVDAITVLDVLEHIHDDRAFVVDLVSKIRPGTRLLFTVPAMPSLWSGWDVALGHHRRYIKPGLEGLTAGLPLRILETSYVFPELVIAGYWRRITWSGIDGEDADEAAFPELPGWLNDVLYRVGVGSLRMRRYWPVGTSLFMAVERSERAGHGATST